ncbi:MAG: hypothetical protein ACREMK_05430 [Gemmatimonadota bacterium]
MLAPLVNAAALPLLVAIALAMGGVYAIGLRVAGAWPPTLLRVLAVAGFVIPGWTVFRWYEGMTRVRDAAAGLPIDPEPVAARFIASSAVLLAAGFCLLVAGVYLARRLPGGRVGEELRG